ncbi:MULTISPECIES: helix-turn-helix domain-containing protein [unclassified Acidovorax]|jgi:AraC-like DNA-binding protein|uniref:helix-turn-helix domain-containing protein n=1 Tax=unclassified Acidovorax TaxID=2684926 RepID=UPI000B3F8AED|nr:MULTISPECIES: AraC family transcriptional regulator [unclassified Acidovorax]MBP3979445.1 helix-turn-helix transcriptional regulator [Acidovorax sp. JG5]
MAEAYALHEGAFGTAIVLEVRANLVAHAHSETQMAFWLGGARANARVGAQVVEYSENVALGVNTFESHDMTVLDDSGSCLFLAFMLSRQWLEDREQARGRTLRFPSPRIPIDAALRQSCWRILDLILSAHEAQTAIDDEVERLLEAAIDASSGQSTNARASVGLSLDHRVRNAIAYMRAHVAEKIAVDDIAAKVGLSRAHFFTLFRDQLNTTPQVFWSAVRVEEAMRQVAEGRALTEVALDLGFSAPGNFSRFFKEHTGVSPSVFRRAAREPLPTTVTGVRR